MTAITNITPEYVDQRFSTFVEKLAVAMRTLGHSEEAITENCEVLSKRLLARDFKTYGETPLHQLQAGKRVTRFFLKLAVEQRPAQKARRQALLQRYQEEVSRERAINPCATFFSFEAAYAGKLRVNLSEFKRLFYL